MIRLETYIKNRCLPTKNIIKSYSKIICVIKFIWWPVGLIYEIIECIVKLIMLWGVRRRVYFSIKRITNGTKNTTREFLKDFFERGYSWNNAYERFKLRLALSIEGRERKKNFGNLNKDKVFFVIRPYLYYKPNIAIIGTQQLLSNYYSALHFIATAVENKWIPVIDWENYKLPHSEDEAVDGISNAWEYFWKQPSNYSLQEVYQSRNVILSHQNLPNSGIIPPMRPTSPIAQYEKDVVAFSVKYSKMVELNDKTKKHVEKMEKQLFPPHKKILGVALRGTSYGNKYAGHYLKQPTIDELIELILQYKELWKMDYIFFTNEEQETVNKVKEILGEMVIIMPRIRYKNYHRYSDNNPNPTNDDVNPLYKKGQRYFSSLDYLTEMVLLSRCNAFLGAHSGGVRAALIWNEGQYEHVKIIDKGVSVEKKQRV